MSQSIDANKLKSLFLQCCICTSDYDEEDHHPRIFPCLHGACYDCVKKLIKNNTLICHNCRKKYHVPDNNVDHFLKDNTRRDLLNFVQVQNSSVMFCNNCDDVNEAKKQAIRHCRICAKFLCMDCAEIHGKVKEFRRHKVTNLEELKTNGVNFEDFCHEGRCQIEGHDLAKFTFYCENEECRQPLCTTCVVSQHLDHCTKNIDEVFQVKKKTLVDQLGQLDKIAEKQRSVITTIEREIHNLDTNTKTAQDSIDTEMQHCISMLENRRKEHNLTLIKIKQDKYKCMQQQQDYMQKLLNQTEESCEFARQALCYRNPSEFLLIEKTISDRLKELQEIQYDVFPHQNSYIRFDSSSMYKDVEHVASSLGKIRWTSAFLPNTRVNLSPVVKRHASAVIEIWLLDTHKNPVNEMVVDVEVQITDNVGNTVRINAAKNNVKVDDQCYINSARKPVDCEGRNEVEADPYIAQYRADIPGTFTVSIFVCGMKTVEEYEFSVVEKYSKQQISELFCCKPATYDFDGFTKKYMVCNICDEEFDDKKHIPILMPCLHDIGKSCLEKSVDKDAVKCAECKRNYNRKSSQYLLNHFPANYLRVQAKTFLATENEELSSSQLSLSTLKQAMAKKSPDETFPATTCTEKEHENERMPLYCNQCKKPLCYLCALTHHNNTDHPDHRNHIKPIKEVYSNYTQETKNEIHLLKERAESIEETISVVVKEREQTNDVALAVRHKVLDYFFKLEKHLNDRKVSVLSDIEEARRKKIKVLGEQIDELQTYRNLLMEGIELADLYVSISNAPAFLLVQDTLNKRLRSMYKEKVTELPRVTACIAFEEAQNEENFKHYLKGLGKICCPSVIPTTIIQIRPEVVRVRKKVCIQLSLFDPEGGPAANTTDVVVKISNGKEEDIVLHPKHVEHSSFLQCSWTPQIVGTHTIYAETEAGNEGSMSQPFIVDVLPLDSEETSVLEMVDEEIDGQCYGYNHMNATITHTFENISRLNRNEEYQSPYLEIQNLNWSISIMKTGSRNRNCKLSLFLVCKPLHKTMPLCCTASVTFELLINNKLEQESLKSEAFQHNFTEINNSVGIRDFYKWTELMKPSNGFIKNNRIMVRVIVRPEFEWTRLNSDHEKH